jgi:hypothetical protein
MKNSNPDAGSSCEPCLHPELQQLLQTKTIMQDYGTNANGKDAVQENDKGDVEIHPGHLVTSRDDDRTLDTEVAVNEEVEDEYIHGIRLWLILISGTLVQFLIMLDVSVIATVCWIPLRL